MGRPLHAYAYAGVAYDDAIEMLARDPASLLQDATDRCADHAEELVSNVAFDVGGLELDRDVVVELEPFEPVEVLRGALPLRWRAARGHLLFPTLDGQLEVAALSLDPPQVQVILTGTYDPPFGPAGDLIDRAGPYRIAEAVAHRFVREVAARLESVVEDADLTSRI